MKNQPVARFHHCISMASLPLNVRMAYCVGDGLLYLAHIVAKFHEQVVHFYIALIKKTKCQIVSEWRFSICNLFTRRLYIFAPEAEHIQNEHALVSISVKKALYALTQANKQNVEISFYSVKY